MIGARNSCTEKGAADPLAATLLIGPRTAVTPVSVRARGGGGKGRDGNVGCCCCCRRAVPAMDAQVVPDPARVIEAR